MNKDKMGTAPLTNLLISMSIPIMISMLVQALYNIVDNIFVSQLGETALSAVAISFPMQHFMLAASVGLGVGMNNVISRNLGAKQDKTAQLAVKHALLLALLISFVFVGFSIVFAKPFLQLQTNDADLLAMSYRYLSVVTLFPFGLFFQVVFERLLQSTGLASLSMRSQILGAVVNITLDPILIFGWFGLPALGVHGAAIATIIGQSVAASYGLYLNIKHNEILGLRVKEFELRADIILDITKIGLPSMLVVSVTSLMNFGMNTILKAYGTLALAVYGIYTRLQSFVFMPVFGLNNAMIPLTGYNLGARKHDRVKGFIKLGLFAGTSIMILGLLIFQLIPSFLLSMFNATSEMLREGQLALRIISLSFVFFGINVVVNSVLQSFRKPLLAMGLTLLRSIILLLSFAYLFSNWFGLVGIWWSFPLAEGLVVFLSLYFVRWLFKTQMD